MAESTDTRHDAGAAGGGGPFVVGRRPVFDEKLDVIGYRMALSGTAPTCPNGPALTEDVLERLSPDRLRGLFAGRPAFVRLTESLLSAEPSEWFTPDTTVLEVGQSDADLVARYRQLVAEGFRLAWHEGSDDPDDEPLAGMSEFRFSHPHRDTESTADVSAALPGSPMRSVATDVHTVDDLRHAWKTGFRLFEGHLLSGPVRPVADSLTPSRLSCLRLLEKVNHPDTTAADLERLVKVDAGLSYRLLHVSSLGSLGGLRRPVRSVREAVVLLGREQISRWLLLMVVADASHGVPEQLAIAMTRARMCELVANRVRSDVSDSAYTVGLISAMDLLLGSRLPDVVSRLAVTRPVIDAVLHRDGVLGKILSDVLEWEHGSNPTLLRCGIGCPDAERCYLDAITWATDLDARLRATAA